MSLHQTLTRARACVQRGQVDAAIKLYRGLLVSMAHHPQINTELGVLLLTRRNPQQAIPHLQKAVSALPSAFDGWVCLMVAHQRSGDVLAARAVLADMRTQGFAAAQLAQFEQELNKPPPRRPQEPMSSQATGVGEFTLAVSGKKTRLLPILSLVVAQIAMILGLVLLMLFWAQVI